MTQITRTRLFIGLETSEKNLEIDPEEVINFIRRKVDAGTFYESKGLWKGNLENSMVFECMSLEDNLNRVHSIKDLKEELEEEFDQESVMIEQTEVEVQF